IVQLAAYSSELMRDSVGNDDDFAFINLMFLAAVDFGAADLVRCDFFFIDGSSACDECGRPIDHVNYIGIERVNLSLTRFKSAAGMDFVTGAFKERHAFGKGG